MNAFKPGISSMAFTAGSVTDAQRIPSAKFHNDLMGVRFFISARCCVSTNVSLDYFKYANHALFHFDSWDTRVFCGWNYGEDFVYQECSRLSSHVVP